MKILILGGTRFVGRHLVDAARARGHAVTLFNRGHHPAPRADVELLRGDRERGDLAALDGRHWDAAIDTSGYVPSHVRAAVDRLRPAGAAHYTFVSTLSVYADDAPLPVDESGPTQPLGDSDPPPYGPLKAACERELPEPSLVVRPGLVVGPFDYTDRFNYWPARLARGGEVLAPGAPERPLQLIDARDLAEWIVSLVEARATGLYNATGPAGPLTVGEVLERCRAVTASGAQLTWIDDDLLFGAGIAPWSELPLWVPKAVQSAPQLHADCRKAIAAGLTFRPLDVTIADTLAWELARPPEEKRLAGLDPERERALLAAARRR